MNLPKNFILPVIVLFATFGLGYVLRQILFKFLGDWSSKTKTRFYDIVVDSLKVPFLFWSAMAGISLAVKLTVLPAGITSLVDRVGVIIWVISLTIVAAKIASGIIKSYSDTLKTTTPITSLTTNVVNIIVFIIGFLILMNLLGISITPIITALGIGGLAVALALQDTLSNLFAGIHTIMSKQVKVGDYVQMDSGQEGYVIDIGWRTTRIKTLPNNTVIIPNVKLSQAIVTNYYVPSKELAVLVQVGVHYNSDLEKVEKITIEVGKEVMNTVTGGVPDFTPFTRYHTFGESSINFTVILRAKEFVDRYLITHEFIKRLKKRYDKEKIVIPFPIRTIIQEKS